MTAVLTIGISAFLLFLIQPMISKMILPVFGGGASIWLTALIFFQAMLMVGYVSSHLTARRLRPVGQVFYQAGITLLALLFVPVTVRFLQTPLAPTLKILLILLGSIGLPYLVLATTGPLLQHWISAAPVRSAANPYVLFGVSNAGSLAGLLLYPVLFEPNLPNPLQMKFWTWGFYAYAVLLGFCMLAYIKGRNPGPLPVGPESNMPEPFPTAGAVWLPRLKWVLLSMIPTAALIVFTRYLNVDIANLPLLWVIPLSIYLVSFVLCFFFSPLSRPTVSRSILLLLPVLLMLVVPRIQFEVSIPYYWKIVFACTALFAVCMYFHGNLERAKPPPAHLTEYYLSISFGGCVGSALAAILAPLVFRSNVEFYLVVVGAAALMLRPLFRESDRRLRIVLASALVLTLALVYFYEEIDTKPGVVLKARSFYGTYTVTDIPAKPPEKLLDARILQQGNTIHGGQVRSADNRLLPMTYYHERTGVASALRQFDSAKRIAVVGLGTGVLALYGRAGQRIDFYEIDPAVVKIAKNNFENLSSTAAEVRCIVGDGRLALQPVSDGFYDVIIIDAFISGSIPTHLITEEALQLYFRILAPEGVVLFNISNNYVNLLPVLNCIAGKLQLSIRYQVSSQQQPLYRFTASWAVLTRSDRTLDRLERSDRRWLAPPPESICWSDDFTHLWTVLHLDR
jgi:spermidine synthase